MVRKTTNRSRRKGSVDEKLLFAFLATLVAGLVIVYSTSSMIAESRFGSHWFFLRHQFIWALISVGAVALICRVDLQRYAVYSWPAFMLTLGLLALVFVMPARNESHRWVMIGPFTLQPSEMFKYVMLYFLAFSLSNRSRNITELRQLLIPYVPMIGAGLGLIMLEPDLGTMIVIFMTALGMFFIAGARIRHLALATMPLAAAASLVVFVIGYKQARVIYYLRSIADPLQGSYQSKQAALTLGAGGILGTGLGDGSQKLFFLPYPHTDFVFAAAGEEIGLVGLLVLLGLMLYMLLRGLKIAAAQPDRFGFLLGSGMVLSLFINIIINLGVVTSLLPVTGLPLPFISYGGSSLLMSSAAIGVLLNLSRRVKA